MNYSFKIINSSAGSGKTFKLAIEFISKLLVAEDDNHFKSMLALTFTNKASAEMKDRILLYLLDLKEQRNDVIKELVLKKTSLDELYVVKRSAKILEKILYNYSNFNVITIDSFTNNIISSIDESNNNEDSLVELDSDIYIDLAIDELISEIDGNEELKNLLIEFAKFKITVNKSWDITYDLKKFSVFIDKESNKDQIEYFKKMDNNLLSKLRKQILDFKIKKKHKIISLFDRTLNIIYENGLVDSDFRGGYFPKYLKSQLNDDKFIINESIEKSLIGKSNLYNKTLEKIKIERIEAIRKNLINNYFEIKQLVLELYKINSTLNYLPSFSIISKIEEKIQKIQDENGIRLISKFNKQLNLLIQQNDTPYIYEKLGSRFTDFYIDEFQDTSELQWNNLIPLISNSIHSESHDGLKGSLLIVGDPKQSIYRWRGGKFNQFINLIYGQTNPFHFKPDIEKIDSNYRSSREIINFNSDFFTYLSNHLELDIYDSDDLNFKQESNKKEVGHVSITSCESQTFYSKIENEILDIIDRGYKPNEIAILVRFNKHAKDLIENINSSKFNLISSEVLQITSSKRIQFLISILKLSRAKNDYSERKRVIDFLFKHNYFGNNYENLNMCFHINLSKTDIIDFFRNISNQKFDFKYFTSLNILNAVKYCIDNFHININDAYLYAFIDNIFEFIESHDDSISSYIEYWEKKSDGIHLNIPEHRDSIVISTIHKAKGLEFPFVIVPIYNDKINENRNADPIWLYEPFKSFESLKWTLVPKSQNLIHMGDNAKEIYESSELNIKLDTINLLYVAFSRAESELSIISKKDKLNDNSLSSIIHNFLEYKSVNEEYKIGQKTIKKIDQNKIESTSSENKKINIISALKNLSQAKYISELLSKVFAKNNSSKVYIFFPNPDLIQLIKFFDDESNIELCTSIHLFNTKILDYDYVLFPNMNEGLFPFTKLNDPAISDSEKKKFESLSQNEQEKKISDIFYKIIDKAKQVHLIYDSSINSFGSGEESRFVKQIKMLSSGLTFINKKVIQQNLIISEDEEVKIVKDDLISKKIESILSEGVSASSLSLFIKNPYLFYEQKILGVDNKDESKYLNYMDQGTLIHRVIEKLYKPFIGKNLGVSDINFMKNQLKNESHNTFIELYSKEPIGKNLIFIEVVKEYIDNTLNFELDQIKNQNARIKIISLEKKLEYNLTIKNQNVKLKGIIDRIDMFNDEVRIIDYKSGNVNSGVLDIRNIDKVKIDHKYSYLLQLLFYKYLFGMNDVNIQIKEIGICSLKKRNLPFQFIKKQAILSVEEIQMIISDIIIDIMQTNEFIDSGNPL